MHWTGWIIVVLAVHLGGWMAFDGLRAFAKGDYVTPRSGEYAGRLGPWAAGLEKVSVDPRSSVVKAAHIVIGVAWLAAAACLVAKLPAARSMIVACSIASLWYLPFGTLIGVAALILIQFSR